ncbi:hypothetical protein JCM8208_007570 [Rhodotorula glutinis]
MPSSTWLESLVGRGSGNYAPLRSDRLTSVSTVASEASTRSSIDLAEGDRPALDAAAKEERLTLADLEEEDEAPQPAPHRRRGRLALAAVVVGAAVALSLLAASSVAFFRTSTPSLGSAPRHALDPSWAPPCPARAFSTGRWVERDPAPSPNASIWASTGFTGCAQGWFKNDWHLGLVPPGVDNPAGEGGVWPMSGYRRRAGAWEWQPEDEMCAVLDDATAGGAEGEEVQGVDVVRLLQDLVDHGAWLIVGDSLSEQQFFSLGCLLFPHVRAQWPYPPMSEWRQIKEEHLFLDPVGPLVASGRLIVPEGFDFDGSPVVSHVRTDHGLAPSELVDIYASFHEQSPPSLAARYPALASLNPHPDPHSILTAVETFSPSIDYYLDLFLRPSSPRNISTGISPSYAPATTPADSLAVERNATRSARYHALLFSTGAHFSSRHFTLPDGPVSYAVPAAGEPGSSVPAAAAASTGVGNAQVEFFELVVDVWAARLSAALDEATAEEREGKVILVRPSSGGHNDCHSATRPVQDGEEVQSSWYSWADMAVMNRKAETLIDALADPQIAFLDLARPASLRPDAHTNDDCLHLSTGTGVIEGWTRYISYYLRERTAVEERARGGTSAWLSRLGDLAPW